MIVRLRGGAKENNENSTPMIERGIANAKFHGVNLHPGVRNLANGDCAFESIIDSINIRSCFDEVLNETPAYWRKKWMSEVQSLGFENWSLGLTRQEWDTGWELLKESGAYEYNLGDLVVPGIAHCLKKDILLALGGGHPILLGVLWSP